VVFMRIPVVFGLALAFFSGAFAEVLAQTEPQATRNATRAAVVTAAAPPQRRIDLERVAGDKTIVRGTATVRKVDPSARDTQLRPGEYAVARWKDKPEKVPPVTGQKSEAWSVGFGFIGVNAAGQEIHFRPVIESAGGLSLAPGANGYQGRIFVGLRDNANSAAAYALPQPVSLLVGGQADELMPRQFTIDHTNLPFVEVLVASQDPPDPVEFNLIAAGTTERATISIPVVRPRLDVIPGRSRIQGLGLETATVSVRAVGLTDPEGRVVTVTSDFASVDPVEVRLDGAGVGTTTVRSVSLGSALLNAASPPLAPASTSISFSWPVAFLVASIAGGLLGSALANFKKSGRKKALQVVLLRGILTGILMAALYAIGVNLLPIQPTATAGEVLVFAVAAVGGFIGLKL
jgi:hypothetical protein